MTLEVFVIAEGQTEEAFIKRVVAPALRGLQVYAKPVLLNTSTDARGGAVSFQRFLFNARNLLRAHPEAVLSCFLDLYKLDTDFPASQEAARLIDLDSQVARLHQALHAAVVQTVGIRPERFIPHIQPHEFEGLLFSDTIALARVEPAWQMHADALGRVRASVATPEHINNGFETKPSRRLETMLKPSYKKTRHGPLAALEIGLTAMEAECVNFGRWMEALRALATRT